MDIATGFVDVEARMTQAAPSTPGPTIAEQLLLLAELANVDAKQKVVNEKLENAAGPAKKLDDAAAALKKSADETELKKIDSEKQKRAIEAEIQDERIKIKKWEARASELKGEREHAALASEIGTAKRVIRQLEDKQLEQMEAIEAGQKLLAELTAKLQKAEAAAKAEWDKVGGDLKGLRADAETHKVARAALLLKLPAGLVKRYEQIAAKRLGVGVSIIKGEVCSACKRTLPPQLCLQVRKGLALETCGSCTRFLVHEAMTVAPAPEPA